MSLYYKEEPEFLNDCLESLSEQSLKAAEIIIVYDGPIPNSLNDVVKKWSLLLPILIYPLKKNIGLGAALNYGLSKCKYDIIARMDTDDICVTDRFKIQFERFSDPELAICGSHINEVDPITLEVLSKRKVSLEHFDIFNQLIWRNPFNHMSVMYRRDVILSVGSYADLPWMEDWYLWLRLLSSGHKSTNIDSSLVLARTGKAMIQRRSGFQYVKSEWLMTKHKVRIGKFNPVLCFFSFIQRSLPRLLPTFLLSPLYMLSRK